MLSMVYSVILTLAIAFCSACAHAQAEPLQLRFKSTTYRGPADVELSAIVHARGKENIVNNINKIKIVLLPNQRVINSTDILSKIRKNTDHPTKWIGRTTLPVSLMVDFQSAVLEKARHALEAWLSQQTDNFSIEPIAVRQILAESGAQLKIELNVDNGIKKRMAVKAQLSQPSGKKITRTIWFSVAIKEQVWVAQQDIAVGAPILLKDFAKVEKDIAGKKETFIVSSELNESTKAIRPIRKGSTLQKHHIAEALAVGKNQLIQLKLVSPSIKISTTAIALENGFIGDKIEVMPERGIESCIALITGKGEVKIVNSSI